MKESLEKVVIDYLDHAEGKSIHRNKTEKDVTAFYGVYRHAHKKFIGWKWLDRVAESINASNYRVNRGSRRRLNEHIFSNEYLIKKYVELALVFHDKVWRRHHIDKFKCDNLKIVAFSLIINAGASGGKAVQRAINTIGGFNIADGGWIGSNTIKALNQIDNCRALQDEVLKNMQEFYDYLVTKYPKKYGIYEDGWRNRLVHLDSIADTIIV